MLIECDVATYSPRNYIYIQQNYIFHQNNDDMLLIYVFSESQNFDTESMRFPPEYEMQYSIHW